MKKRLEADLISIAHRILQIKDKSDVSQLYLETQKLYEKLSVLKFVEENYSDAKPTIGSYSEIEKEVEGFYDKEASLPVETQIEMNESNLYPNTEEAVAENEEEITEPETSIEEEVTDEEIVTEDEEIEEEEDEDDELVSVEETETEDSTIEFHESEPEMEEEDETEEDETEEDETEEDETEEDETEEDEAEEDEAEEDEAEEEEKFTAAFELTAEDEDEQEEKQEKEEVKKPETVQISFEDLLGLNYNEPEFVKVDDVTAPTAENIVFEPLEPAESPVQKAVENTEKITPKPTSLNDKFSKGKGIDIDLNDRIAFVKHLFGNSNEDYNRVMNQLITYDNFYETKRFIDEMVKPDYNNWEGKEEYEERFMEIIEKKFL